MSSHIIIYNVLLALIFVSYTQSIVIEFDAPNLIHKNVYYKLKIINDIASNRFPVDDFLFLFELLETLTPRKVLSIGEVQNLEYTGEEFRGFSIKNFTFSKNLIEMQLKFSKEAYKSWFLIRYVSAKTETEKEDFFIKNTEKGIVFKRKIEMLLPYTIVIQVDPESREVSPEDKEAVGHVLLPERNGQLTCSASEGLPNPLPEFVNIVELLEGATVNRVNNDVTQLIWKAIVEDHGKEIQCRAGEDFKSVFLNVYHYMSDILTSPVIGERVGRGSQLKCISKDGYPIPRTYWLFVSGPLHSSKYYEFRDNNATLFINSTAPLNSNWTFECRGLMDMPTVVAKYLNMSSPNYPLKRLYNFTITGESESNSVVQSSSTALIVILILLMILVIVGSAFGVIHKEKIRKFINDKRLGANQLPKTLEKPQDPGYKYCGVEKTDARLNGNEKEDATCYLEIVGTIQPKPVGPIHRV